MTKARKGEICPGSATLKNKRDKHQAGLSPPEELVTEVNQQVRDKKAAEAMGSCLRPGRDTAMEADDTKACPHAKRIFLAPLDSRGICMSPGCFRHHWGITSMCCSHVSKKLHGGRAEHGMFLGSYSLSLGTEPSLLALGRSCLLLGSTKVLV